MSLEDYKKKVEAILAKQHGEKTAKAWMKEYEEELPEFFRKGWKPALAATAIVMSY
ncbi:MAG: hypothetical protein IKF46_07585 [Erysipelotrichaceae bacterium]|nr:hypothetical protein [Erysipelotrichaceae bacterium]